MGLDKFEMTKRQNDKRTKGQKVWLKFERRVIILFDYKNKY